MQIAQFVDVHSATRSARVLNLCTGCQRVVSSTRWLLCHGDDYWTEGLYAFNNTTVVMFIFDNIQ
jgi:hypothetical protein